VKRFSGVRQYEVKVDSILLLSTFRRETSLTKSIKIVFAALITTVTFTTRLEASTRTLETRFALSADARSEFSTRFPLLSSGRILLEASWSPTIVNRPPTPLTLSLTQPDGTTVLTKSGSSVLRLQYNATEQDVQKFGDTDQTRWTVKILNDATDNKSEVSGTIRITVPTSTRSLEDTQFTLLGSGNAQEIPFSVPAPGKLLIDVSWQPEVSNSPQVALIVSLIHPGEAKTFARRQGSSPISVEQQVTEEGLDRGSRWVVRVQNDSQTKVSGTLKISYTPSL
jgi:hypothetical protein